MADVTTEWITSRFRDRLTRKVESRSAHLESEGCSVSRHYAGEMDGKHQAQLIVSRP